MPRSAAATSESLGAPGVLAPAVTTYARAAMFAAAFFYALSYTVISPTLPFFARELERRSTLLAAAAVGSPEETGDPTWLHSGVAYGMVMSGYGIAKVVSAPLIGHLSDRCGRRATLLWTLVGGSVCAAVSGCFGANGAMLVAHIKDTTARPADFAVLLNVVDVAWKAAYLVAPVFVTLLDQDYRQCTSLAAVWLFVSAAVVALTFGPPPTSQQVGAAARVVEKSAAALGFWPGVRANLCSHSLVLPLFVVGLFGPSNDLAPMVQHRFHGGAAMVGWATSLKHGAGIAVSLAGTVGWAAERYSIRNVALVGLIGKAGCYLYLAYLAHSPSCFHLALAAQAAFATVCNPGEEAFVHSFASAANYGGYIGLAHGIRGATDACALMLSSVTSAVDVRLPWLIGSLGGLGKAALILAMTPHTSSKRV